MTNYFLNKFIIASIFHYLLPYVNSANIYFWLTISMLKISKAEKQAMIDRLQKQAEMAFVLSIVCQPFEVMRTSSVILNVSRPKSLYSLVKYIVDQRGFYGLFRGSGISIGKNFFSVVIFYFGIDVFRRSEISKGVGPVGNFFIGGFAKFAATFISSPLAVIKTRIEGCNGEDIKTRQEAVRIWRTEGYKGFFKGIVPSLIRDVPFSGIQYSLYTGLNNLSNYLLPNATESYSTAFINGGVSSAAAILITYPFDNIRVRMQFSSLKHGSQLKDVCRDIYQEEGMKGFFAGCMPRLMRKVVTGSIMWGLFENIGQKPKSH